MVGSEKPGATAGQRHPGAFDADVNRLRRQRPHDIGEQPTRYQNASRRGYFSCDLDFCGNLVVESRDGQPVIGSGEQHPPCQHGHRRPRREIAGNPGDRIGEVFAGQSKFQIRETCRRHVHSVPSMHTPPTKALPAVSRCRMPRRPDALRRPQRLSMNHRRAFGPPNLKANRSGRHLGG